jgi:hypothetical protein
MSNEDYTPEGNILESEIIENKDEVDNLFFVNPEYKLLCDFDYNSGFLFNFINENSIDGGEDFCDTLYFSIYNFLLTNQNKSDYTTFKQIFKNLKKLVLFANKNSKSNKPLFYLECIYKSLYFFTKLTADCNFYKKEKYVCLLEKILEWLPMIFYNLTEERERKEYVKKCIRQLNLLYRNLHELNEEYNKINKQMIKFSLKNICPFEIELLESKQEISLIDINIRKEIVQSEECKNQKFENLKYHEKLEKIKSDENLKNKENISIFNPVEKNKEFKVVSHNQDVALKKSLSLDSTRDNSRIFEDMSNLKLNNKIKNFSDNHYTRDKFKEKFIIQNNLDELEIHNMLQNISMELYKIQSSYCSLLVENLEISKLQENFSSLYPDMTIELIGSSSLGLYSNIENRTYIDLIVLPKETEENTTYSCFTNMREFLNMLNNFNDEFQNESHKFILDNIEDSQLEQYFCDTLLASKRSQKESNANVFAFRENLKISNDILKTIFSIENLRILHVFVQEIFIKEIPICSFRSDISILILSYIDHFYNIFDRNKKVKKSAITLGHETDDEFEEVDIKIKKLITKKEQIFHFEINLSELDKLNLINPGELILEFMRYMLNFLTYLKIKYFEKGCPNSKHLDFFKSIFELDFLEDESYLFNLSFMYEYLELKQVEFLQKILEFLGNLESIFFKICENSGKINNYNQILSNIKPSILE